MKYKHDTRSGHSGDLYQLLSYATAAQLRDATLIYAEGAPSPVRHRVRGTDVTLHVHHLRLNQPPRFILQDIAHLAAGT